MATISGTINYTRERNVEPNDKFYIVESYVENEFYKGKITTGYIEKKFIKADFINKCPIKGIKTCSIIASFENELDYLAYKRDNM